MRQRCGSTSGDLLHDLATEHRRLAIELDDLAERRGQGARLRIEVICHELSSWRVLDPLVADELPDFAGALRRRREAARTVLEETAPPRWEAGLRQLAGRFREHGEREEIEILTPLRQVLPLAARRRHEQRRRTLVRWLRDRVAGCGTDGGYRYVDDLLALALAAPDRVTSGIVPPATPVRRSDQVVQPGNT